LATKAPLLISSKPEEVDIVIIKEKQEEKIPQGLAGDGSWQENRKDQRILQHSEV